MIERLGAAILKVKEVESLKTQLAANSKKHASALDELDRKIKALKERLGLSAEANEYVALTPEIERYQNLLELADFKISQGGRAPKVAKLA